MSHLVPQRSSETGFTLIELLVAMVVGSIIVGAAFTVLTTSSRALKVNEQVVDMQQSARMAMELLSRDMKMAGFGASSQSIDGCKLAGTGYSIVPKDNNINGVDTGPDSVWLVVPTTRTEGTSRWTLSKAANDPNGITQINLQSGAVTDMVTNGKLVTGTSGSYISIGGVATAQVSLPGSDSLTISKIPAPTWFQVEDPVYLLQCVSYRIEPSDAVACAGSAPCLMRGLVNAAGVVVGEAPIAQGIEDLQLAYACDGCTAINNGIPDLAIDDQDSSGTFNQNDFLSNTNWQTAPLTPDKIQLVQIALVARQSQNDQGLGESDKGMLGSDQVKVIADKSLAADRTLAADPNHRRRILIKTVETRNVGL